MLVHDVEQNNVDINAAKQVDERERRDIAPAALRMSTASADQCAVTIEGLCSDLTHPYITPYYVDFKLKR